MNLYHSKCIIKMFLIFASLGQLTCRKENTSSSQIPILEPYGWKNDSYIIELAIVVDNSLFNAYNRSTAAVKEHVKSMTNNLNFVFQKLNVFIALVRLEIWSDRDKIEVLEEGFQAYYNFQSYAEKLLKKGHIDDVQLISSKKVGPWQTKIGGIGTSAYGVNEDNIHFLASNIAMNMGIYDKNNYTFILCNKDKQLIDLTWCSWAFEKMASLIKSNSEIFKHLKDKPIKLFDGPVCGNGFLEQGEECDCGIPENCGNSCCDAKNCTINPNIPCPMG